MNPETIASKRFRKKFIPLDSHQVRVENPAGPGTPDYNFCLQGKEKWLEFKQVKALPRKPETPVFTGCLEPHQALWLKLRTRAGGKCYVVGYVEKIDKFFIIPGQYAMEFNSMPLKKLQELTITPKELLDAQ